MKLEFMMKYPVVKSHPDGQMYRGGYGYPCVTAMDCTFAQLECNHLIDRCDCQTHLKYENGNCLEALSIPLRKYCVKWVMVTKFKTFVSGQDHQTTTINRRVTHYISRGNGCFVNSDCFSDALVCIDNKCECASTYENVGAHCMKKSGKYIIKKDDNNIIT